MQFHEQARAKVNLTLRVLGKRADGYHELESVVAFARCADVLSMDLDGPRGCTVAGPFAGSLVLGDNLVVKALDAVASAYPPARLGHVTLDKRLPVAAGIGGGSADAAAVLRMARRHNPDIPYDAWMRIAASLGADVPVCFVDRAAVTTGTGTAVAPLDAMPILHAVLANPRVPVPADKTAAVFRRLAAPPVAVVSGVPPISRDRWNALTAPADLVAALAADRNDLETPARSVMPIVADVLTVLRGLDGVRFARLSGAGPTCFATFDDAAAAGSAAAILRRLQPGWWIEATTLQGASAR